MSSIRVRTRRDGTDYTQVMFRHAGKQQSMSFDDHAAALRWRKSLDELGAERALELLKIAEQVEATPIVTIKQAGADHIDNLSGVSLGTRKRYRAYMRNDIEPFFGAGTAVDMIPDKRIRQWVNWLEKGDPSKKRKPNSAKTIANKHGFLYALMEALRKAGTIPTNPCADTQLPRVDRAEMTFLEIDEFEALYEALPKRWQLLVKFLVATGARWGEVTALKVRDVDRRKCTVRIVRAWKYTGGERELGKPKTKKSVRTIDLDPDLVAELPLAGRDREDWLFVNGHGGPIHVTTFYKQVWRPTLAALAAEDGNPLNGKTPRIHDLRHTCASWMLDAGIPIGDVQEHLGHESIQTTKDRYGHVSRDAGKRAAAAIGARLPKSRTKTPPPLAVAA
ncbi:tyrosine-type recombinase/integrase [Nocardia sp. NPDC004260]